MTYHREKRLIWLATDPQIFHGKEIAEALTSTSLPRRRMGVQLLYELASAERARLVSDCPRWFADQALYNELQSMWRHEERLLMETERMMPAQMRVA